MSAQRSQSRVIQDDYVRTGEAVSLDVTPASPPERFAAAVIDGTTYLGVALLVFISAARTWSNDSASLVRVFVIGLVASVMFFVPFVVEVTTKGRSLGKWALNLRVVRDDGGAITARHSAVRVGVGILENWLTSGGLPGSRSGRPRRRSCPSTMPSLLRLARSWERTAPSTRSCAGRSQFPLLSVS